MCSSLVVHPIVPHGENHSILVSAQYSCLSCVFVIPAASSPCIIAWCTPVALYSSHFHPPIPSSLYHVWRSPLPWIVEPTLLNTYTSSSSFPCSSNDGITSSCLFTDNSFCVSTSIVSPARTSISPTQFLISVYSHSWYRCHPKTS